MKKKIDPSIYRCSSRSRSKLKPKSNSNWCYKVASAPEGKFIVQVRGRNGLLIVGHLSTNCQRTTSGKKVSLFSSKESADQAAQRCIVKASKRKQR